MMVKFTKLQCFALASCTFAMAFNLFVVLSAWASGTAGWVNFFNGLAIGMCGFAIIMNVRVARWNAKFDRQNELRRALQAPAYTLPEDEAE